MSRQCGTVSLQDTLYSCYGVTSGHTLQLVTSGISMSRQCGTASLQDTLYSWLLLGF